MNILIVNQSIIDMCASFVMLLIAVVEVDGTRMSRDNIYDQFVCRVWLTRLPLWALLVTSTYGFLLIAFERYVAVIYPIWYNVSRPVTRNPAIAKRSRPYRLRPKPSVRIPVTERKRFVRGETVPGRQC